uniref:RNase H type-1 domain-containing protein n=1 Tax=Hordeum vulgare subsp. vulgare TaxID=112509 RepID=A0A8I6XLU5_HORVV
MAGGSCRWVSLDKLRVLQRWEVPDFGWIKVNSDGAVSKHRDKGGGGAVLRDHNGAFLAAVSHYFPSISNPVATELLAYKHGLEVAREINATRVHLELDSLGVVQALEQTSRCLAALGSWIQPYKRIKALLASFADFKVLWVRRSANAAALKSAKVGVGDELCKVWLGVPPDFVLDVISDEIQGPEG